MALYKAVKRSPYHTRREANQEKNRTLYAPDIKKPTRYKSRNLSEHLLILNYLKESDFGT